MNEHECTVEAATSPRLGDDGITPVCAHGHPLPLDGAVILTTPAGRIRTTNDDTPRKVTGL